MAKLTEAIVSQTLEYAYEKAIRGFIGVASAMDLAESYKEAHPGDKRKQAEALINRQIFNGASSGFLTGLGGLATLPLTIPANIFSALFIQIRMIAAIAIIGGHDPKDEKVKTLVFSCLVGSAMKDLLKEAGINIGTRIVLSKLILRIPEGALVRIARSVAIKVLPRLGTGAFKWIPIVSGVIGGAMDGVWVASVGKVAKSLFVESDYTADAPEDATD